MACAISAQEFPYFIRFRLKRRGGCGVGSWGGFGIVGIVGCGRCGFVGVDRVVVSVDSGGG